MRIVVLCLGLFLCGYSNVLAVPITFDFSSNHGVVQYSAFGVTLNVSAGSLTSAGSIGGDITWFASYGLGVDASTSEKADSSKTLDGSSSDDFLTFDFGSSVLLRGIVFSSVGGNDEVRLLVGGATVFDGYIDGTLTTSSNVVDLSFLPLNLSGQTFSLMAFDSDDSFRVKSMTIETAPIPTPEPSTWLLLSVGVGGLAYWRRRQ